LFKKTFVVHNFQSTYNSYEDMEVDYLAGKLHPGDLKPAVSLALNKLIEPVRNHFRTDPVARQLLS
jgi:tyrosyl-tRNA synthetase